ncbi:MAG: response regulator [Actinomycetota bacterium]|nr:response regulator [Actinomycetota bacterium]
MARFARTGTDRILIVDDDESIRGLLGRLLGGAGHDWAAAADAAEARRLLAEEDFALMLCDIEMPGESGLDLVHHVLAGDRDIAAVMVSGIEDPAIAMQALDSGAYGYVVKPFSSTEVLVCVANVLRRRNLELEAQAQHARLEQAVHERTAELRDTVSRLEHSARALQASREETIQRLSRAVEFRDPETAGHVERMSHYCSMLAERVGLDAESTRVASTLHDVGKIGVPDGILLKPGPLTGQERKVMERHATIGHEILGGSGSPLLDCAATIAWTHHERFDGTGYPRGLSGEAIPLLGRVAAVADVFDALTTERVYRPALGTEEGLEVMRSERGRHFDPCLLDLFLGSMDEVTAIMRRFRGGDDRPLDEPAATGVHAGSATRSAGGGG